LHFEGYTGSTQPLLLTAAWDYQKWVLFQH